MKAKKQGYFSEAVSFSKDGLSPEIYQPDATSGKINMTILPNQINDFTTYSPYPNPFVEETNIPYTLDASTFGMLNVFDLTGKVVLQERRLMASGRETGLFPVTDFLIVAFIFIILLQIRDIKVRAKFGCCKNNMYFKAKIR